MKHLICTTHAIPPGEKRAYTVKNIPLLVVHTKDDEFYAIYRFCPHQRSDLSAGILGGLTQAEQPGAPFTYTREDQILRCPWHSFSFDVTTGSCLTMPDELRVKTYPLLVEGQELFLDLSTR